MIVGSPIILNLVPGGVMKCVHVNQVNKNIEIQFKVMNGAAPYNVSEGVTCTIRGTKGDAFGYAAEAAVTVGSNVVTVTLTEQMTAVAGAGNIFELVFVGAADDMKVSTENFILAVERQAMGEDTVISDSDLSYSEQVLDQLQSVGAVNAQVQQNKANLAAEISRAQAAEAAETAARQAADNTLQSNINAEASTRATQDASLQSQINQLIAPSGSAPSAAEVENARVGADGTTYPTLGDAIRTQVTDVKSALLETNYTTIPGKYLNKNNGTFVENSTGTPSVISDIPVLGGSRVTLTFDSVLYGSPRGCAFYDVNGNFIPGSGVGYTIGTTTYTMTAPAKATSMAFTTFSGRTWKLFGVSEVADVVKKINEIGSYPNGINLASLDKTENYYVNGTSGALVAHNSYDYYKIKVFPGTKVYITPGFTHASVGYSQYDENGAVVAYGAYSSSASTTYEITVNSAASYILFSVSKSVPASVDYLNSANEVYLSLKGVTSENATNPYAHIGDTPSFIRMFRKIACIGDSLTAGVFNTTSPTETNNLVFKDFSYPACMAKLTGVSVYNLGAGGATAAHPTEEDPANDRSWWGFMEGGARFDTTDFTNNPCDAYIIALGTNDITKYSAFTGTVDASGVADPSTSVGGYAEIIEAIKTYQPKAKIFLVTISRWRNTSATRLEANNKIKALAEYYTNCYVIDLETYDYADFGTYYKNGSHNNALGYNLRARQYSAYIDWIIKNNLNDFRNVAFIGTDYDFTE